MVEERGYTAITGQSLTEGGQVDVVVNKDQTSIAVEISFSTDVQGEVHNISKRLGRYFYHSDFTLPCSEAVRKNKKKMY